MLGRTLRILRRVPSRMTVSSTIVPPRAQPRTVNVPNEDTEQRIARAKGYPYPRPDTSFIFVNGEAYTFPCGSWRSAEKMMDLLVTPTSPLARNDALLLSDVLQQHGINPADLLPPGTSFTPLLAIGSNAAPEQLARKFPGDKFSEGIVIPVIQCVLQDFDVVYAPLISSYGSATATLEHSPGTSVSLFMTYLTPPLQQRMHETEGSYNLMRLDDVVLLEGLSLEDYRNGGKGVRKVTTVYQYNHQHGTLMLPMSNPGIQPVALAEIAAEGRRFKALAQVQMQVALSQALKTGGDGKVHLETVHLPHDEEAWSAAGAALDEWILDNLNYTPVRRARVAALTADAAPFKWEKSKVLLAIGSMFSSNVK